MAENRGTGLAGALATLLLLAGAAGGRPAGAGARVWAWGGPTLEILVDTRETWRGLRALALESPDGSVSARSLRCFKAERHITAAFLCVLPGAAARALPDRGWIVGSDDDGRTVLRERADLRPLKAMIN